MANEIDFSLTASDYTPDVGQSVFVTLRATDIGSPDTFNFLEAQYVVSDLVNFQLQGTSYPLPAQDPFTGQSQPAQFTLYENHPGALINLNTIDATRSSYDEGVSGLNNSALGVWEFKATQQGKYSLDFLTGIGGAPQSRIAQGSGLEFCVIPEPSSFALASIGLIGSLALAKFSRRRK